MADFTIITLLSGTGSNFRCLVEAQRDYRVIAAISDKSDAPGLEYARKAGIPVHTFPRSDFADVTAQKERIFSEVTRINPNLVTLAGYMQIVPNSFCNAFAGKIINIHPSLLPAYPGLDTHARVLHAKEKKHGCSVHFVDSGVDTGPIIAQAACNVLAGDNDTSLSARVLELEHKLYPWVVSAIARGDIAWRDGKVFHSESAQKEARRLDFLL